MEGRLNRISQKIVVASVNSEIVKLGKELSDCGEFASATNTMFHGFSNAERLISALESGVFGRRHFTSIGTEKSTGVPYYERIEFRQSGFVYPVFYYKECDYGMLRERIGDAFGIGIRGAQVNQWGYKNEQEWYVNGPVKLSSLNLIRVTYRYRTEPNTVARIKSAARRWNVPADAY